MAPKRTGRASSKGSVISASDAHHAKKGSQRHNRGRKRTRGLPFEMPMEEKRIVKPLFEQAKTVYDAGPSPAGVTSSEDIHLKNVAGLSAVDPDGPGERMNARAINAKVLSGGRAGHNLSAACIDTLDLHFVAGLDMYARRERAVPDGMGRCGRKRVN